MPPTVAPSMTIKQWLDKAGETFDHRLDFGIIEVADLLEHRIERTGLLTDGDHLDDHGWEHWVIRQGFCHRLTL